MSLYSANISMKFSSVVPGLPKTYRTPRWRSISNSALLACMAASSPWLPAEPAVQGLEPLARELRALAVGDDLALLALHLRDALLQPVRDLQGEGEDAVLVSVEQVPRADGEPAHLHRTPEVHEVDVGVGNRDASGEEVEAKGPDLVQVADAAVGHRPDAAQGAVDVALDLPPVRPDPRRGVEVLEDDDAGRGDLLQGAPHLEAEAGRVRRGRGGGPAGGREGVAHHRPELREEAADLARHETRGARADVEGLHGVRQRGSRVRPELGQDMGRERLHGGLHLGGRSVLARDSRGAPAPPAARPGASMTQWQKNLYTLWAAQFLAMVGLTLIVPFIPLYIRVLGVERLAGGERWSGLWFAAPFLMQAVAAPLWGVLGDRYGRKVMVLRAMGGIGLTSLLSALVRHVQELLLLRGLQGGVSGFVAAANALVSADVPRERLGTTMAVLQTSLTAGGIIGPLIGGALADAVGYRWAFVVNGLLCWAAGAVVLVGAREPSGRASLRTERPGVRANLAYVLASPALRTAGLLLCTTQVAVMSVEPIFPLFVGTLGVPAARVATLSGVLFSVTGLASILGAPVWGRAADRVGAAFWLFLFRSVLGFFVGGVLPPLYAIVGRLTPSDRLGGIMGVTSSAIMIGNLIGPLLGGWVAASLGMRPVFALAAAVLALSGFATRGLAEGGHPAWAQDRGTP